jgi:drug/metabolite transporter (DMT)-like permease
MCASASQTSVFNMLIWAPVGITLGWNVVPGWGLTEWGFVVLSGVLHIFYFIVLLRGYRKSDLTVVYPLARGSGPLLSSLAAVLFLGEKISAVGVAGIAGVVGACSWSLAGPSCGARRMTRCSANAWSRAFATA